MKKILHTALIPVIFIVICAIFFYPTLLLGKLPVPTDTLVGLYYPWRDLYGATNPRGVPYKNFLITDPVRQQIPWKKLVVDNLKQGKFPSWSPYSFSGTSLVGNIQAGTFSPFNFLFLVLSFPVAWTTVIILQPILAGLFMYIFLKHNNLQELTALMGAITWSFCGFFIAWLTWGTIDQTALWLPLILLAIDVIAENPRRRAKILWSIVLALASVCAFFAGHAQVALYVFILAGIYGLQKKSWWLIAAAVAAFIASSVQWIPFIQALMYSSRAIDASVWFKEGWFLPWQHLVQFIAPDFFGNPATLNYWGVWNYGEFIGYIGILPLICAVYAVIVRKDRLTRFFAITLGIIFLFMLPNPIAKLPFEFHIPMLSTLQPTRLMVLVDFNLVMLAVLGLDYFLKNKNMKILYGIGILFILFVGVWMYVMFAHGIPNLSIAKRNLILPSILFIVSSSILVSVVFFEKRFAKITLEIVIILVVFDLFRFGWKFTPFTPQEYFFPATQVITFLQSQPKPFRIMSLDTRILPPNTPGYYGIESVEGYDPVYEARYEEFIAAFNRQKPDIAPPFGFNRIITVSTINSKLLPLLNVKYILSLSTLKNPDLKLVYENGETKIYQYMAVLPRIYPVESVVYAESKQQVMNLLYS